MPKEAHDNRTTDIRDNLNALSRRLIPNNCIVHLSDKQPFKMKKKMKPAIPMAIVALGNSLSVL